MSDIKDWADDADLNGEASPAGWPEGMPPSDVNNSAREMMAAIRRSYVRQPWYAPGGEIVRVSGTQITIKDDTKVTDYSQFYTVGQRFRVEGVEYNTTGFISSVSYEAPTTTIGFEADAEKLLPGTIKEVYVGLNYQDVQGVAGPNLLGCIIGFTEESSKIGAGLLHANGLEFSPSLYPDLAKLYLLGTNSDGTPNYRYGSKKVGDEWWPRRPDVRGYFPRFLDDTANKAFFGLIDKDTRTVGSIQEDAIINITGKFPSGDGNTAITEGGPFYRLNEDYGVSGGRNAKIRKGIGFDLSKATRTATETRPKNIAVVGVIVAYGGVVAGGLADISEVLDDVKLAKDLAQQAAATIESLGDVMRYCGSVDTYADLPTEENEVGDVYNVLDTGVNYAWTEEGIWDEFGGMVDLSDYALKTDIPTKTSELENDSGFITAEDVPEPDLTGCLQNTATGTRALSLIAKTPTSSTGAINIGQQAQATALGAVAIGGGAGFMNSYSKASGNYSTAIGSGSIASNTGAIAISGQDSNATYITQATGEQSIAVGCSASATKAMATAIGPTASATGNYSTAIGSSSSASGANAIQLGQGTNSTANTLQFRSYTLLDANGKIPAERLPDDIGGGSVDLTGYLQDTATAANALTIAGTPLTQSNGMNIGPGSATWLYGLAVGVNAKSSDANSCTAIGNNSVASASGSLAVGNTAKATQAYAIQIGKGTNSTANTMSVGLSDSLNVKILDANGKIPGERMSLQGTTAPTTSTAGNIGQFYVDTAAGTGYMCVGVSGSTYTWKQITS